MISALKQQQASNVSDSETQAPRSNGAFQYTSGVGILEQPLHYQDGPLKSEFMVGK